MQDEGKWASVKLTEVLVQKLERYLTRIEGAASSNELGPRDCFDLFSYVGELKFGQWSRHLTKSQFQALRARATAFEDRLRRQLSVKGELLLSPLHGGFEAIINDVYEACKEVDRALNAQDDDALLDFDEFDHGVLHRRDRLQYALDLSDELGLRLDQVRKDMGSLDDRLKKVLPRALGRYRDSGDFVAVDVAAFPKSFWWRLEMA